MSLDTDHTLSFADLGLDPWLLNACTSMGISQPTHVQTSCIPPIIQGRNVVACSQTGSGKTASYVLPILHRLAKDPFGVFALVLVPTRELAFQVAQQFAALGSSIGIRCAVIVGGQDAVAQSSAISKQPHVVIATIGRLAQILSTFQPQDIGFQNIKFLVLDEADRLLDKHFAKHLAPILAFIPNPSSRQSLLFSATITPSVFKIQNSSLMQNMFRFDAHNNALHSIEKLQHRYILVPDSVRIVYLAYLLSKVYINQSIIVFTRTCLSCELTARILRHLDLSVIALHSQLPQHKRISALNAFRASKSNILVATDVASRGIDVPRVDIVINYELPQDSITYIHRAGRTARAHRKGSALSLVTQYDIHLVLAIEAKLNAKLIQLDDHTAPENKVMQLLSSVLKAKRMANMELVDSGFLDLIESRKENSSSGLTNDSNSSTSDNEDESSASLSASSSSTAKPSPHSHKKSSSKKSKPKKSNKKKTLKSPSSKRNKNSDSTHKVSSRSESKKRKKRE